MGIAEEIALGRKLAAVSMCLIVRNIFSARVGFANGNFAGLIRGTS